MKSKTKIIIFSLLILVMSISAVSAHENIITDVNDANNDMISINQFDDGLDDSLDDSDEGYDVDSDDWDDDSDDWDVDSDDWDVDSDDWDDDSDDWDDDSDDWDDDSDDWDVDSDDWDDDFWDDDWDDAWGGNYTNSSIKFYKTISYYRDGLHVVNKTDLSLENMTCDDLGSEDDYEDICDDDSQEEFDIEDSLYSVTACLGASASFEVPDALSQDHGSVSKSINQGQNLLDNEKDNNVNVTDDTENDTITFSSDNDLNVFALLFSLLLCIIVLI